MLGGGSSRPAGAGGHRPARRVGGSAGVDLDGDRHAVRDDVEHRRTPAGLLDDLARALGIVTPELERGEQGRCVDAVADRVLDGGHVWLLLVVWYVSAGSGGFRLSAKQR